MARLCIALIVALIVALSFAVGAAAQGVATSALQTYSNISGINTNSTIGCNMNSATSQTVTHVCFPDGTIAGNTGILACGWANGTVTATPSDDGGSTWTSIIGPSRHAGGQDVQMWRASPLITGTHQVTVTFSAATSGIRCAVVQLANVTITAPVDGSINGQSAGSTTVSAGSITSTVANDLYIQFNAEEDQFGTHATFAAGSGWTFESADPRSGWFLQTKVNPTASALTCSATASAAVSFNTSCVALKRDLAQGSFPTGMYVRSMAMFTQNDTATSYTYQSPCMPGQAGGLLAWTGNTGASQPVINSITHANPGTSFAQVGTGITGVEGVQQIFWDIQTWTNDTSSVFTMSSTGNENNVQYYCVAGASATGQPDSTLATGSGNCTSCSGTTKITITPSSNSGIMFATMGIALQQSTTGSPQGTQDNQDNNNHWTHFTYSSTAAQAFTVTVVVDANGPGNWSMAGVAFKAPSVAAPSMAGWIR